MALDIVCGPFQPGLEDAFIDRLRELGPGIKRPVAVVAPSGRMAARLERLIGAERGLSLLGVDFHTFHSLAESIVERSGMLDEKLVRDGIFHDRLVDRILKAKMGEGLVQRGLASSYRSSIRDLVDAGLDTEALPEDFYEYFKDPAERKSIAGLVGVASEYLKELGRLGVTAPGGVARLAAKAVVGGKAGWLERCAEFLYYGFYDLTGAQADFFEAIAKTFPTKAFFPYVKGHPAYAFANRLLESSRMRHGGAAPSHRSLDTEGRALKGALSRLFDPSAKEAPGVPALEIFSVSGSRDEVWRTAKEILLLTERAQDPVPFHEIGVVARELGGYAGDVKDVFREHKIPHAMSAGEPLMEQPIVQVAVRLLRLHRSQYPAQTVLDIVGSPFFRSNKDSRRERNSWRRLLALQHLHSGWLQWEGKIAPFAKKDFSIFEPGSEGGGDPLGKIPKEETASLWEMMKDWRKALDPGSAPKGWAKMTAHATALLERTFSVSGSDPASRRAQEAWGVLLEGIEGLKVLDLAEPEAAFDDFLEALEQKIEQSALEPPRECLGVRVMDSMAARGESFKILFVLGLKQGLTPREVREDPFLSEDARRVLGEGLGLWIWEKLASKGEEKLLFHSLLNSASEKVYCIFPRSDEEGKAQTPSTYLQQLLSAAGIRYEGKGRQHVPRRPFDKVRAALRESGTLLSPKEASAWLSRRSQSPRAMLDQLKGWEEGWDSALLDGCLERLRVLNDFSPKLGRLDGITGRVEELAKRAREKGFSPSSLEILRSCPFRFFAEKVLFLEEGEQAAESGQLLPWAKGQLYHGILKRFHERLLSSGFWEKKGADWRLGLEDAINEILNDAGWRGMGVYPVVFRAMKERMSLHLGRLVGLDIEELRKSGFKPELLEIELKGEVAGLKFKGRVDRVDYDGKTYRVVDYKSRWRKGSLRKNLKEMKQLQAVLYQELLCADAKVKAAPESLQGASYLAIEDSKDTNGNEWRHDLSGDDWRAARKPFFGNLKKMIEAAVGGSFPITPESGQGGACEYCAMDRVCRKGHRQSRWRAENAPERKELDSWRTLAGEGARSAPSKKKAPSQASKAPGAKKRALKKKHGS